MKSTSNLRQSRRLKAGNDHRCSPQPLRQLVAGSVPAPKGLSERAYVPILHATGTLVLSVLPFQKLRRAEAFRSPTRVLEGR